MKTMIACAFLLFFVCACTKQDSIPDNSAPIMYSVITNDSTVNITYSFVSSIASNGMTIKESGQWKITGTGSFDTTITAIKGYGIDLNATSYISDDFELSIKNADGQVIAKSDTAQFAPVKNQYSKSIRISL